jgi:hypothetical protein
MSINMSNLNSLTAINNLNNLTKQNSKKECLSEPEGRFTSDLKQDKQQAEESSNVNTRQNYQKTTQRNRSKRVMKFKSQSKVEYKIFDSEKLVVNHLFILG